MFTFRVFYDPAPGVHSVTEWFVDRPLEFFLSAVEKYTMAGFRIEFKK